MTVIDADGHVSEPPGMWPEYLPPELHALAPRLVKDSQGRRRNSVAGHMVPPMPWSPEWGTRVRPGGADPKARIEDMDSEGIDIAVLFPTIGLFFGGVEDQAVNSALCQAYNSWLADYASVAPGRLVGVALVAHGDVHAAAVEARRAVEELGFHGVMVRPNPVAGRNLDDPYYEPLWATVEELGVPVCIHEGTTLNVVQSGDRFENFAFRHACSHPHEQQIACLSLICGGVLERHPGLKVVFLESGCGWLPYWLERMDEHQEVWGFVTRPLTLEPSEYFARQCFITAEPDEKTLPWVADLVGDDRILFASDYPHPDAIFPGAVAALRDRTDLSDERKDRILGGNAAACFSLT